jgi:centractin
MLYNMSL